MEDNQYSILDMLNFKVEVKQEGDLGYFDTSAPNVTENLLFSLECESLRKDVNQLRAKKKEKVNQYKILLKEFRKIQGENKRLKRNQGFQRRKGVLPKLKLKCQHKRKFDKLQKEAKVLESQNSVQKIEAEKTLQKYNVLHDAFLRSIKLANILKTDNEKLREELKNKNGVIQECRSNIFQKLNSSHQEKIQNLKQTIYSLNLSLDGNPELAQQAVDEQPDSVLVENNCSYFPTMFQEINDHSEMSGSFEASSDNNGAQDISGPSTTNNTAALIFCPENNYLTQTRPITNVPYQPVVSPITPPE